MQESKQQKNEMFKTLQMWLWAGTIEKCAERVKIYLKQPCSKIKADYSEHGGRYLSSAEASTAPPAISS